MRPPQCGGLSVSPSTSDKEARGSTIVCVYPHRMGKVSSRQSFLPRIAVMRRHRIALPLPGPFLLALGILAGWTAPALAQSQTSRHGGIEIGAKGVKATVLEVSLDKQGRP